MDFGKKKSKNRCLTERQSEWPGSEIQRYIDRYFFLSTLMRNRYIPESLASFPIGVNITTCYLVAFCITCKGLRHKLLVMVKDLIPALFICSCFLEDSNRILHTDLRAWAIPLLFRSWNGNTFFRKIKLTLSMKLSIRARGILLL